MAAAVAAAVPAVAAHHALPAAAVAHLEDGASLQNQLLLPLLLQRQRLQPLQHCQQHCRLR
jgi:hypothetical protein